MEGSCSEMFRYTGTGSRLDKLDVANEYIARAIQLKNNGPYNWRTTNLVGINLVGLGLAALDGFPVEGVSEDSSISPAGRRALSFARASANKRLTRTAPTF